MASGPYSQYGLAGHASEIKRGCSVVISGEFRPDDSVWTGSGTRAASHVISSRMALTCCCTERNE